MGWIFTKGLSLFKPRWSLEQKDNPPRLLRGKYATGNNNFHLAREVLAVLNFQNKWRQRKTNPVMVPVTNTCIPQLHFPAQSRPID